MTFPNAQDTNSSSSALGTSHTVNLPANIAAGDLLYILLLGTNTTYNTPAGWTAQIAVTLGVKLVSFYRSADGSEAGTVTITTSANAVAKHISWRTTGYSGTPEFATASASSTTPDPPNLAPSWGSADTLWIAIAGTAADDGSAGLSVPTNYSALVENAQASSTTLHAAERDLNAASENPGTFSGASNTAWLAATVAVKPAAAAGGVQFRAFVFG